MVHVVWIIVFLNQVTEPGSLTGWEAIIEVVVYNELLSQTGLSTVVKLTGSTADVNHQSHQCGLEMVHHYTICGRQESLTKFPTSRKSRTLSSLNKVLWGKALAVNPRGIAIFVYKWKQARVGDREAIRFVSSRIGIWVDWTRSVDERTRSKVRKFAKLYQSTVIKPSSPIARDRAWSAYLRQRESCHLTIQATKCRRLYCTDWHCHWDANSSLPHDDI